MIHMGFACLMLGNSKRHVLPNSGLMVICHGKKSEKSPVDKSTFSTFVPINQPLFEAGDFFSQEATGNSRSHGGSSSEIPSLTYSRLNAQHRSNTLIRPERRLHNRYSLTLQIKKKCIGFPYSSYSSTTNFSQGKTKKNIKMQFFPGICNLQSMLLFHNPSQKVNMLLKIGYSNFPHFARFEKTKIFPKKLLGVHQKKKLVGLIFAHHFLWEGKMAPTSQLPPP